MELLFYNQLETAKVKKQFDKVVAHLQESNFRAADVKKMVNTGYYRAKLDDTNRLLFRFGVYQGKKYIFVLEVILNHAYEKSRFLNGAVFDEGKLMPLNDEKNIPSEDIIPIHYINTKKKSFHLLDKILSFDGIQDEVLNLPTPNIIIGSAGSGKTALTLEKLKKLPGRVLYTTLSPYLVENASNIYSAYEYENGSQEVEFLSFFEYVSTIEIPKGKEVDYTAFDNWIFRFRQSHKIKDSYKIFEEFKGVITGSIIDKPYLSKQEYLKLGIKQSIFSVEERETIYDLFTRYLDWMNENNLYDSNILSYSLLDKINAEFDFVVVDEVQDITNIQLMLILKSLHNPSNFLLCGDSNQIVHPNFFSWSNIKTLFYNQDLKGDIIRILSTNYRNTPEVTKIANQLLMIKNARFGSIDKESTYLVKSNSKHTGIVEFLEDSHKVKSEINNNTKRSTKFAVLVLRNEDKAAAKAFFQTPLLFSIQEAKGLEYENIILFNAVSGYEKEFRTLTQGVTKEDLLEENLKFSRVKDKSDKSLDEYKFYVNSLYVGMTRAITNLYVIEANKKHELLALLGLTNFKQQSSLKDQSSTNEEWQREARKLEMQGKKEQAEAIRNEILQVQKVPWEVLTKDFLKDLKLKALDSNNFNKKAKDSLFSYAIFHNETNHLDKLSELKYRPADTWRKDEIAIMKRNYGEYQTDNIKLLEPKLQKYGIDYKNEFSLTPFMLAIRFGATNIANYLIKNGSSINVTDLEGKSPLQYAIQISGDDLAKKANIINRFYPILKNESLKIKVNNRLLKIDSHQAEFLMLNFMISSLRTHLTSRVNVGYDFRLNVFIEPMFQANDFIAFFIGLTPNVITENRKKRSYISSILSKNEVNKLDKYNKQIFLRVKNGFYLPNPAMAVQINDEWINLYDHIDFNKIGEDTISIQTGKKHPIFAYINEIRQEENESIKEIKAVL
jgi:superfamily I DNA/RNA helicase